MLMVLCGVVGVQDVENEDKGRGFRLCEVLSMIFGDTGK